MRIAVIGGTGLIGAKLVAILRGRGYEVVAASLAVGVDTVSGEGLAEAIAGSHAVIDVTNPRSRDDSAVLEFFQKSSRNLLTAAQVAHVKHYVALSLVGADRLSESGYFRAKLAQEDLIRAAPIPHTILRSTQFFEFMVRVARADSNVPSFRISPAFVQPISADEVAAALADIATTAPRNDIIEAAGPGLFQLDECIRLVKHAFADPQEVVTDARTHFFGAELRGDSLVPNEEALIGVTRLEEWLHQLPALATKKTGRQLVEGPHREGAFSTCSRVNPPSREFPAGADRLHDDASGGHSRI